MAKTDNEIRYRSPVYKVMAVPVDKVVANAYNPNAITLPTRIFTNWSTAITGIW